MKTRLQEQKLKKKFHFKLGSDKNNSIGRLYLKKKFTNIFITLTDLYDKVIICRTSGIVLEHSKRRKTTPQAIESIMLEIRRHLQLYNIKRIHVVVKMRLTAHFYTLLRWLENFSIIVISISSFRKSLFTTVKNRKIRRV